MATLTQIDDLAAAYSANLEALAGVRGVLEDERRALLKRHRARLVKLAESAKERRSELVVAIADSAALFVKPRTVIFHGLKLGFQKSKAYIVWDSESAVIARIRKLLPEDQAELLIRVQESIYKKALDDLTTGDLKRLGISVQGGGDEVLVKGALSDLDKWLEAILADDTEEVDA